MKLFVINTYDFGSTGSIAKLAAQGFDGETKFYSRFKRQENGTIDCIHPIKYHLDKFFARMFGIDGFLNKRETKALISQITEFNPDVIHLHNLHSIYLHLPTLFNYFERINKPIIITLHDAWLLTGRCCFFGSCNQWKDSHKCGNCTQKKLYPKSIVRKNFTKLLLKKRELLIKNSNNIIFVSPSKWLANLFMITFPCIKTTVINNGIDTNVFFPIEKKVPNNKIVLLGVAASFDSRKGIEYFNALADLIDLNKYEIRLCGEQSDIKINSKIKWHHGVEHEKLVEIYNEADIFVNLSIDDNYPTTLLESISCGIPVISFDVGGCKEIVSDCGCVVESKNVDSLLNAIYSFKIEKYKVKCLERRQHIDKSNCSKQYGVLYKEIL